MHWTSKPPTQDGFYWCQCKGILSGKLFVTVVKVSNNCTNVFWDGDNFAIDDDSFIQWSDQPIPQPT